MRRKIKVNQINIHINMKGKGWEIKMFFLSIFKKCLLLLLFWSLLPKNNKNNKKKKNRATEKEGKGI